MKAAKLTSAEAKKLIGKEFAKDSLFNPIDDANGNFFISIEEIKLCDKKTFAWIKDLPLIKHVAKPGIK